MFRDAETFATNPAPVATLPDEVDALLSWLPAWLEAFDRRQLVTNCRWLSADDCGMADFAAHQIFAQPAIVWG